MRAEAPLSVCPHDCPGACPVEVAIDPDSGKLKRLRGSRVVPYTDGVICAKVARYDERLHHPDRLTRPLRRVGPKGSGRFEPIDWDTALDTVAEAFASAAAEHGPESVWPFFYAGTMGLVQRDGINRLRNAMGYSGQLGTICTGLADPGWFAGVGAKHGVDAREIADSDLVVLWGLNAVHTQVQLMTWVAKARKGRGARLVVVDPYRTPTAQQADLHIAPRPGTDGALACAMMQVMFAEGLADRDYMAAHTDDPAALETHLATRTPEWAARITGIPAEDIVAFARLYGRTKRAYLRLGYGFTRQRNGAAAMHAVSCLPAVSGAWAHPGGGAMFTQSGLFSLDTDIITGADVTDPGTRVLNMVEIGPILCGDAKALKGGPPVKAMLIQNTNPMVVAPDSDRVAAGFAREDLFVCVHEQFMTETAAMADIVLPATMFLEHDDLYKAGGHTYLQVARAVMDAPGECRENHVVIQDLAARLGARHPGFNGQSAWHLIDTVLTRSDLPPADEILRRGGYDGALPFEKAHFLDGFPNPTGRFRFRADWAGPMASVMPPLPDHLAVIEEADETYPYRLVTAPARGYLNTSFTETPGSVKGEGRPTVMINPADAGHLGVADGSLVKLTSRRGHIDIHARLEEGIPQGIVVVESLWPNKAFPGGKGVNTLTGADLGPPLGGAAFHDTAVRIEPGPDA